MHVNRKLLGAVLMGALAVGSATSGCQTAKEATANAEPAIKTEAPSPMTPPPEVPLPVSLGNNPHCDIAVVAKSPDAVADPCMTTTKFIQTIAALSDKQKRQALQMVAASTEMMQKLGAKLAH